MRYQEAVDWIHGQYGLGNKNGLENERALLEALGNPQEKYPCIHVAGTNGKGSTCAMIASVLRAAGLKVGIYTSPYLIRYNERMRVDGQEIPDEGLAAIATDVRVQAERLKAQGIKATVFELGTACAFTFFARQGVDVAVIEVGLGGRLDSTNVITPAVCAITHIGLDHVKVLGDTLEKIAAEKAGIIKRGVPCVLYPQGQSVAEVVKGVCQERGAPFIDGRETQLFHVQSDAYGHSFGYSCGETRLENLKIQLPGSHQLDNVRTALRTLEALRHASFALPDDVIRQGLADARWPGRLEWHEGWLLDGAHNAQGAAALAEYIMEFGAGKRRIAVCGIQSTKDVRGIVQNLAPALDHAVCVPVDAAHPTPPEELAALFADYGVKADVCGTLEGAMERADAICQEGDWRLMCGSLYLVGAARARWNLGGSI